VNSNWSLFLPRLSYKRFTTTIDTRAVITGEPIAAVTTAVAMAVMAIATVAMVVTVATAVMAVMAATTVVISNVVLVA
jgi:hypothetical protein